MLGQNLYLIDLSGFSKICAVKTVKKALLFELFYSIANAVRLCNPGKLVAILLLL